MNPNIQLLIKIPQANNSVATTYQFPMADETLETLYQDLQLPYEVDRTFFDCAIESPKWLQNALGNASINLMELDYLDKRLDSFDQHEGNTYIAVVEKEGLHDMTDLINMTFHSNNYTLITDVSSLAEVGQARYMSQHGYMKLADLDQKYDLLCKMGEDLLRSGTGTPTDRGILFPPESKEPMKPLYTEGGVFPTYDWSGDSTMNIEITSVQRVEQGESPITALLPMSQLQQNDLLLRMGIKNSDMVLVSMDAGALTEVVNFTDVSLYDMNYLAKSLQKIDPEEYAVVGQIAALSGQADNIFHVTGIADNFKDIIHVPSANTSEKYGRWLIYESGNFDSAYSLQYEGLDNFFDFEGLGEHYKSMENGIFTDNGYFAVRDPSFAFMLEPAKELEQTEYTTGMELQ